MGKREVRWETRLDEKEAKRAEFVAKALDRSQASALRFLLDQEYRVRKGHPETEKKR